MVFFFFISANRLMYSALRKTVQQKRPTPTDAYSFHIPSYDGGNRGVKVARCVFCHQAIIHITNSGIITIIYSEQKLT